ncbi:unnamed protein product [Aphanomyces euteiches]|uniref:Serine/threonine-protein phosphatase 2A activator n=1 Tax=Aphanomyces euteiches TaxID=100861 RepID=A0A6G0X172_9STRA|nr:hypothetical protein Ae201684_009555 [Aphanomyces euteiches]KAH9085383.1 hypothetical protein Ae201684P_005091 [Aphanomyces euteiches]KAH9108047.1 hypothetical protein LEN26_014226 [Aphanomyces euteiches]KAH9155875.1 hypothetical protein AeRB84_002177 [Aphanomyces euteiches]
MTFVIPQRAIFSEADLRHFVRSNTYEMIMIFVKALNESVKGKKLTDEIPVSQNVESVCTLLATLSTWIDEIPPIAQPMRFGNKAFRDWYDRLVDQSPRMHEAMLQPTELKAAAIELCPYLIDSFGNRVRIDYGTGHETSFILWLCGLHKIGFLSQSDFPAIVLKIFHTYLTVMRRLQKVYMLEPAGSHGVWGLDDYQCLPFYFGSSQLIGQTSFAPSCVHDDSVLQSHSTEYLYLDAVRFVREVKSSGSFAETSPMLNDISGVHSWEKINGGMLKLYEGEVLKKFPVIQHLLFGSLIPCTWKPSQSGDTSYKPVSTHPGTRVHAPNWDLPVNEAAPWTPVEVLAKAVSETETEAFKPSEL